MVKRNATTTKTKTKTGEAKTRRNESALLMLRDDLNRLTKKRVEVSVGLERARAVYMAAMQESKEAEE